MHGYGNKEVARTATLRKMGVMMDVGKVQANRSGGQRDTEHTARHNAIGGDHVKFAKKPCRDQSSNTHEAIVGEVSMHKYASQE